nr:MAG TPA: hypothetical protein [Caudoviricetes sp.]
MSNISYNPSPNYYCEKLRQYASEEIHWQQSELFG